MVTVQWYVVDDSIRVRLSDDKDTRDFVVTTTEDLEDFENDFDFEMAESAAINCPLFDADGESCREALDRACLLIRAPLLLFAIEMEARLAKDAEDETAKKLLSAVKILIEEDDPWHACEQLKGLKQEDIENPLWDRLIAENFVEIDMYGNIENVWQSDNVPATLISCSFEDGVLKLKDEGGLVIHPDWIIGCEAKKYADHDDNITIEIDSDGDIVAVYDAEVPPENLIECSIVDGEVILDDGGAFVIAPREVNDKMRRSQVAFVWISISEIQDRIDSIGTPVDNAAVLASWSNMVLEQAKERYPNAVIELCEESDVYSRMRALNIYGPDSSGVEDDEDEGIYGVLADEDFAKVEEGIEVQQ